MSTLTAKMKSTFFRQLPEKPEIRLLPQTDPVRREIYQLLDRAVTERGPNYIDKSHRPIKGGGIWGTIDYGCIMGYLVGLKGVSADALKSHGLEHYLRQFGWDRDSQHAELISMMICLNDQGATWGQIRDHVRLAYPVAA